MYIAMLFNSIYSIQSIFVITETKGKENIIWLDNCVNHMNNVQQQWLFIFSVALAFIFSKGIFFF